MNIAETPDAGSLTLLGPRHGGPVRIFVGGPIKAGFRDGSFDPLLGDRVRGVIARLEESGADVASAHQEEGFQPISLEQYRYIVARDFSWMDWCDVYLPLLPLTGDLSVYPSVGTGVEIGWATLLGKPVIILLDLDRVQHYSPFLRGLPDAYRVEFQDLETAVAHPLALRSWIQSVVVSGD